MGISANIETALLQIGNLFAKELTSILVDIAERRARKQQARIIADMERFEKRRQVVTGIGFDGKPFSHVVLTSGQPRQAGWTAEQIRAFGVSDAGLPAARAGAGFGPAPR